MASRRTVRTKKAAAKLGIKARRSAAARKGWQTRKERSVLFMTNQIDEVLNEFEADEEKRQKALIERAFRGVEPPYLPSYFQTRVTVYMRPAFGGGE